MLNHEDARAQSTLFTSLQKIIFHFSFDRENCCLLSGKLLSIFTSVLGGPPVV